MDIKTPGWQSQWGSASPFGMCATPLIKEGEGNVKVGLLPNAQ
jgi:hypothetical protein